MVTSPSSVSTMSLKVDPENSVRQEYNSEESVGVQKGEGETFNDAAKVEDAGPPDGGTVAWLVVLGAWCCSFSSPGWINSAYYDIHTPASIRLINLSSLSIGVGSFQAYYEAGPLQDYSSSTIAWIPSLQIFFVFALGPVLGILFDNYGPRPLIIVGTAFHVFGLMMASLAKTYYQFILSQGVCSAVGVACLYSPGKSEPPSKVAPLEIHADFSVSLI
jgi:hypothetical protein